MMGDLTKNFNKAEFDCNCGCEMPKDVLDNVKLQVQNLQILRDFLNKPIKINSAYRCPYWNSKVGGASKSQHLTGNATDIVIQDYTPYESANLIESLIRIEAIEEGGVGRYDTFTHYDRRGTKTRWNG
jgi:uncharacterized protein YcbK (DUF882 family)